MPENEDKKVTDPLAVKEIRDKNRTVVFRPLSEVRTAQKIREKSSVVDFVDTKFEF